MELSSLRDIAGELEQPLTACGLDGLVFEKESSHDTHRPGVYAGLNRGEQVKRLEPQHVPCGTLSRVCRSGLGDVKCHSWSNIDDTHVKVSSGKGGSAAGTLLRWVKICRSEVGSGSHYHQKGMSASSSNPPPVLSSGHSCV